MNRKFLFVSTLSVLLACASTALAQSTNIVLTNAIDVLSLPGESAFGTRVAIRGVVTAAEPDWEKRFFVQDATAGVFVEANNPPQPQPGDEVEVTGTTSPGGYAPFVTWATWRKIKSAELPAAKLVPIEQLMAGVEDSQRIEVSGIVRGFRIEKSVVVYGIVSGGFRLAVHVPATEDVNPQNLIGARVRVRGTAGTFFSGQLRQLITVEVHVPFVTDFFVEKTERGDPFDAPALALNHLAQYRRGRDWSERVHVKGILTYQRPGQDMFLQDATSGIQVKSAQTNAFMRGDSVEAVGFLEFEHFLPVLEDAQLRKMDAPRETVEARPVAIWELQAGYRHADLIELEGKVLESTVTRGNRDDKGGPPEGIVLTLQNSGVVFTVEGDTDEPNQALANISVGSTVAVNGICLMQIGEDGRLRSLHMLLPTAADLRLLEKPNWLTPERLRVSLLVAFSIIAVALGWGFLVHKKNLVLNVVVREKTKAQEELQESHTLLESRVAERTHQLKFEMTARKESEVRFKATIAERTRLARELHDTLEQSLTAIGFQLDTASILLDNDPAGTKRHVSLARNLMTQSQLELRRSVWDLRSRELEQFDFPSAMRSNAQQITENSGLKMRMEITGEVRSIPEVAEDNLLRISQEGLTNVIKHSGASEVAIRLQFGPENVVLEISDNGKGFDSGNCPGSDQGHFGLAGMSERVKRLRGEFVVRSAPGQGTTLEIKIPFESVNGNGSAESESNPSPPPA